MRLVGDKPTALRAATTPGQLLSQTLFLTLGNLSFLLAS